MNNTNKDWLTWADGDEWVELEFEGIAAGSNMPTPHNPTGNTDWLIDGARFPNNWASQQGDLP